MKSLIKNEEGSILAIAMFVLLVLSMFGTFALNTSDFEINIAGNQQRWEKNFNLSEGASFKEGSGVGFAGINGNYIWYQVADPESFNTPLVPTTLADFDPSNPPGSDMPNPGTGPGDFDIDDSNFWPRQNLLSVNTDEEFDYAYLVTYLFPDIPPKGTSATKFSSYKFRINGQKQMIIEIGGYKIGVKNPL